MAEGKAILAIRIAPDGIARLKVTGPTASWDRFYSAISQSAPDCRSLPGQTLSLPWWQLARILPQIPTVADLSDIAPQFDLDAQTEAFLRSNRRSAVGLEQAQTIAPMPESEVLSRLKSIGFARSLKPYQVRNVTRLAVLPNSATFSVPGAGKTTEVLATYAIKSALKDNILIVCPKNAFAVWEEQITECFGTLLPKPVRLTGGPTTIQALLGTNPKVATITYNQLSSCVDLVSSHLAVHKTVAFIDESHRMKRGAAGAWGLALLSISHLPVWKVIMSGTPMPNGTQDLLPQIQFLYPTIEATEDDIATQIQHIYVRTTKDDLKLPKIQRRITSVPMTEPQQRLYRLLATRVARDLGQALGAHDRILLRRMGRSYMQLLQAVSNPSLLARFSYHLEYEELRQAFLTPSPKIEYACLRARQLASQHKKCLIWTGFVENVELIARRLADLGADFIHGQVEAGDEDEDGTREQKIARFHDDPTAMVLVANPAAASESISLHTVCHYAIYVDRNYNAAQYLQSADRIHRIGLPKNAHTELEVLISPDTIDHSVERRLDIKIAAMERVLNDRSIQVTPEWQDMEDVLDEDDMKDLLATLRANK
jgi:SNF2 family DNA or RNA helicase